MANINSFDRLQVELNQYINRANSSSHSREEGLEIMNILLNKLGRPQDKYHIIHIAGTSGKTSTSYYISRILSSSGLNTGLTVSPHIDSIAERFQVGMSTISEEDYAKYMTAFLKTIKSFKDINSELSYFHVVVSFAFWYFAEKKIDVGIIETGFGGLLDYTNVDTSREKVCVITDIGFDHTKLLGNTIDKIAAQKAGIIKHGSKVYMNLQSEEIMNIVRKKVQSESSQLNIVNSKASLLSERNWALAKAVANSQIEWFRSKPLSDRELKAIKSLPIIGRLEEINIYNRNFILDGAHNSQKIKALIKELKKRHKYKEFVTIIGLKEGKDFKPLIDSLAKVSKQIIFTEFDSASHYPIVPLDISELKDYFRKKSIPFVSEADIRKALIAAIDTSSVDDPIVVTGSLYLISDVRRLINKIDS